MEERENMEERERLAQVDNYEVTRVSSGDMRHIEVAAAGGNWKVTYAAQCMAYGIVEKAVEDEEAHKGLASWFTLQYILATVPCFDTEFLLGFLRLVDGMRLRHGKEIKEEAEAESMAGLKAEEEYKRERETEGE